MREVVFRFDSVDDFLRELGGSDHELLSPMHAHVAEGEWVLSVFEIGTARERVTAAAARGFDRGDGVFLLQFAPRDWQRLLSFGGRRSDPPPDSLAAPTFREAGVETTLAYGARLDFSDTMSERGDFLSRALSGDDPDAPTARLPGMTLQEKARILLVDDDEHIRDIVETMLDAVGLTVEAVPNAEDALTLMGRAHYDLLVLDWNLPAMTGLELCRLVRRDRSLGDVPILFLTAHAASSDLVEAFSSGADDYVTKPFRAPELGARVFGLLRRKKKMAWVQASG